MTLHAYVIQQTINNLFIILINLKEIIIMFISHHVKTDRAFAKIVSNVFFHSFTQVTY